MENFIVSARKYRPSTFNSVVGQNHITNTLKNAIRNNQLAQAFLFTGPRGVGKTTCARILAKTINCMNLDDKIEPCNVCESCKSFNNSVSFNIHELDAASNNSVDDIRQLVDQVRIPPQLGKYKVYIIDEVHMLSQQAFNAFLKTLEEPPAYAKFILATTEKHKIIPTILSRCQIYDFKRIGVKDIAEYLNYVAGNEGINAEEEALQIISQKADGALRDALSIFDQLVSFTGKDLKYDHVVENLNVLDYDYYFTIADHLYAGKLFDALLVLDKIIESGFDGQHFLSGLGGHLRDLLVCQDQKTIDLLEVGEKIKNRYQQQSGEMETAFLLRALDIVQKTDYNYRNSNNKRLQLEIALMQISVIMQSLNQPVQPYGEEQAKKKTLAAEKPSTTHEKTVVDPSPKQSAVTPSGKSQPPRHKIIEKPAGVKNFMPGSVSITEEEDQKKEEKDPEEVFDTESDDFKSAKALDPLMLEKAWKELIDVTFSDRPDLRSSLALAVPGIDENFQLHLEVKNAIQKSKIDQNKPEILPFLREKLGNRFVSLKVIVNADLVVDVKPVSPQEKFDHLAEKNPAIIVLQKKFGLEPEY